MMNFELKEAIIRRYGTQTEAAKDFGMKETRLSRLIRGHDLPWRDEAQILRKKLGLTLPVRKRGTRRTRGSVQQASENLQTENQG